MRCRHPDGGADLRTRGRVVHPVHGAPGRIADPDGVHADRHPRTHPREAGADADPYPADPETEPPKSAAQDAQEGEARLPGRRDGGLP